MWFPILAEPGVFLEISSPCLRLILTRPEIVRELRRIAAIRAFPSNWHPCQIPDWPGEDLFAIDVTQDVVDNHGV